MTTVDGSARAGASIGREHRQPGSPASRLDEASQQLAIVLEEVDLEADPEFGAALVEAIEVVDEAARARGRTEGAQSESGDAGPFEERGGETGSP